MSRLRSFLYRSPRFAADCRMDFIHGDCVLLGTCLNLSESGLRGTFDGVVAPGTEGLLTLYHADHRLAVKATVYSVREGESRLRFSPTSDAERAAVADLLKLFAVPRARSSGH
jgi:hypothetical protein